MDNLREIGIKELWSRYSAGERNFTRLNLTKIRLRGYEFKGVDFTGCDFSQATMYGCNFFDCCFNNTQFVKTLMGGMLLDDCQIENAFFRGCDMEGMFCGRKCTWKGSRLKSCQLRGLWAEDIIAEDLELSGCKIDGSIIFDSTFQQIRLTNCDIRGCNFNVCLTGGVVLSGCDLRGSDFFELSVDSIQMLDCDLSACQIAPTRIDEWICKETRMPDGSINNGTFM